MKADDFKDFCDGGRYGGSKVLLQLHGPGTIAAQLDARKEIAPVMERVNLYKQALAQLQAQGMDVSNIPPEIAAQLPPPDATRLALGQPVPFLLGKLEQRGDLLLLHYVQDGVKFAVTVGPDDVKHITIAESAHIVAP